MIKVLVVSYFFSQRGMGAQRLRKLAKYLPEYGIQLLILTGGRCDRAQANVFRPSIDLFESMKRIYSLVRNHSKTHKNLSATTLVRQNRLRIRMPSEVSMPDKFLPWVVPATIKGVELIKRFKPDVLFSSSGPPASTMVAALLNRYSGIPWCAEFRDLWWGNPYDTRRWIWDLCDRTLEEKCLRRAGSLVTVSRPLRDELKQRYNKPTFVVYNGFDEADYPKDVSTSPRCTVCYTGKIYSGKRDPSPLFKAIRELADRKVITPKDLVVRFFGPGLLVDLQPLITQYDLHHFCEVHDEVPHEESIRRQCEADILLLLGWNHPADSGVLTGKLFEYLGAGVQILATCYPYGQMAEILRETGAGVVVNEPSEIAKYLLETICYARNRKGEMKVVSRSNRVYKYSYRLSAARLAGVLKYTMKHDWFQAEI